MRLALAAIILACVAAAPAAVTVDLDLDRLRALPEAGPLRERLDAALTDHARRRHAALAGVSDFDPRRDLHRVVLDLPGDGQGSARLIGLPAERLAALIDLRGDTVAHLLPRRPEIAFVPVAADQALLTRVSRVPSVSAPAALASSAAAIRIAVVPGGGPHPDFLALVARLEARGDGAGAWTIDVDARDAAAANGLTRRFAACQRLAATAGSDLPEAARWAPLVAGATLARDGLALRVDLTVPAELRAELIERGVRRLVERLRGAGRG